MSPSCGKGKHSSQAEQPRCSQGDAALRTGKVSAQIPWDLFFGTVYQENVDHSERMQRDQKQLAKISKELHQQ